MYGCSLLIFAIFLGPQNWARSDDAVKNDLAQFQGTWQAVAMYSDGQPTPKDEVQATSLVVEGNKFTLTCRDFAVTGKFAIDATKTPKTIDVFLAPEGDDMGKTTFLGIYEIKGDKRKSCFAVPATERPTQFSPARGYFGFEWKRN